MNIDALRVFNSMQKLGITEEEFADIEREQKESNTGLYIAAYKKGYSIGVSHDQNHKIVIHKIKGMTKEFVPSRIFFKTLCPIFEVPKEIFTLHRIAQYKALDKDIKFVADNLEELKDRVIDRFMDKYPKTLGEELNDYYSIDDNERERKRDNKNKLVSEQLEAIFWLFDEDYKKFQDDVKYARPNVPRIIKAFQRNNRRLAVIQENEDYQKQRGGCMGSGCSWYEEIKRTVLKIKSFGCKDGRYNYCSPNREIYLSYDRDIWIDDDLFEKISKEELEIIANKSEGDWVLLNADKFQKYQSTIRLEVMSAKRKSLEEKGKARLVKSIESQFKKGKIVRNGITIAKTYVEYEGVKLVSKKVGDYIEYQQVHLASRLDFNEIVKGFLQWILKIDVRHDNYSWKVYGYDVEFEGKEDFKLGSIKVNIKKVKNRIFINDISINKEDILDVLLSAMEYHKQEDYEKYLKYTCTCNLRLQKAIKSGGVSFELNIDSTDDNDLPTTNAKMTLSFEMRREKNKTYVKIKDKEYKVKDHNSLFSIGKEIDSSRIGYSGGGYLQRTIKLLYKALDEINHKTIGELIADGKKIYRKLKEKEKKEYKAKIERSKKFIEHAVKLTKAVKIVGGYKVKGISGTLYTVDESSGGVNKITNGKKEYLCIVDMGGDSYSEWGKNDKIAKRLLMLSKDKKVASEVYDMGDKMDSFWKEV